MIRIATLTISLLFLLGCHQNTSQEALPILGPKQMQNGEKVIHPIRDFELINHRNQPFRSADCTGKIRVADFFFTSCPSICPKVQQQMIRISEEFREDDRLLFLSHSFDTKRDTVGRLAEYARQVGYFDKPSWQFLTGEKDSLYALAHQYFNVVIEDETAPGGFNHTGRIVLVDTKGYIRAFADGTSPKAVDSLILSIKILLREL